RPFVTAAKKAATIPVFAVGCMRTHDEAVQILDHGEADMIGVGQPFYAESGLPMSILGGDTEQPLCESSNRWLPPQMLGMKAACYNPNVARKRAAMRAAD